MPMEKWIEVDGVAARDVESGCVAKARRLGAAARYLGSRQVVSGWGAMAWAPSGVRAESSRAPSQLAHLARTAGAREPEATISVGVDHVSNAWSQRNEGNQNGSREWFCGCCCGFAGLAA